MVLLIMSWENNDLIKVQGGSLPLDCVQGLNLCRCSGIHIAIKWKSPT